jgi:SAM-dependent methyltransferase
MNEVFGRNYADIYDAIYRGKDYAGEVDLIERILARHGATRVRARPCSLLDIGCGTGRHALAFARRGYDVTGIDRSPFMLQHARAAAASEAAARRKEPRFIEADARELALGERFDAVLMMFTVLGYQYEEADLLASLRCVREHLEPGGLFMFDVWNGLAVLAQGPASRTAAATDGTSHVTRTSSTRVDARRQLCHVHFEISRGDPGGVTTSWSEDHTVRYFLPVELEATLDRCGLKLLELWSFPDGEGLADERAWNVIGVARAV